MSGPYGPFPPTKSLAELDLDRLAADISTRMTALDDVDHAGLIAFGPGDFACFLALAGKVPSTAAVGRPLPRSRARYLRQRARLGIWIERWHPRPIDGSYGERLALDGLTAAVYVPLRTETTVPGVLVAGTTRPNGPELLERRLSTLAEFGLVVSGLVADGLAVRGRANSIRGEVAGVIRRRAFRTVFQPIIRFESGEIVAVEALTRFADGIGPERRFGEAESVGLGLELEVATLESALEAAPRLRAGVRLNVNVSPEMVVNGAELRRILSGHGDRITLELTEQQKVDDYHALRRAVGRMPAGIHWAIDDAGAGFASLRHIIELRPQEVKIDRGIVDRVDIDPIRQAVIAGLGHFAAAAGCRLIAEGVETQGERERLIELGVAFGQGYLFGEPGSLPDGGGCEAIPTNP
jgi:EAL domain-containing protein (putative c-di-GMP-specific phosphodiesterase class I)